ncbi:MAG TPA: glycine zipper domain-containing protein [Terriglobales bacterium]|nr:glycine zipper domain-containing protein [Terriglobales bacterium]
MIDKHTVRIRTILFVVAIVFSLGSSDRSLSEWGKIGAIGALTGAAAGGMMGSVVGHTIAGVAIGGGVGLSAGALFGGQWKQFKFLSSRLVERAGAKVKVGNQREFPSRQSRG